MRTRWLVLALGLSIAGNLFFIGMLLPRRAVAAATKAKPAAMCCAEERQLREKLVVQLCARPVDRTAISATFAQLDLVRARERSAALERWLKQHETTSSCSSMDKEMQSLMCPWKHSEKGQCAPNSTPGMIKDQPAQPKT